MGKKSSNKRNKKLKIKPNEIVQNGAYTFARYGNAVEVRNNLTPYGFEYLKEKLAGDFLEICKDINLRIARIREIISNYNPLSLLHRGYFCYATASIGKTSPTQFSHDDNLSCRMVDYVQSIIVSTKINSDNKPEISQEKWDELFNEIKELYTILNVTFHLAKSCYLEKTDPNYDKKEDNIFVLAQMNWALVTGNRYYVYEIQHLKDLLLPHNEIFKNLFGITIEDFIDRIGRLGDSLVCGFADAMDEHKKISDISQSRLDKLIESGKAKDSDDENIPNLLWNDEEKTKLKDLYSRLYYYDLFNVQKITGFSEELLNELSLAPGEDAEFFAEGDEYAGWPLKLLPINQKPFLKINGNYYCFDQHSLFDDLYRIIQRLIFKLASDYKENWNEIQQKQSEKIAINLFRKLLPDAEAIPNVFTKCQLEGSNRHNWCENDGLIIYDDFLIILEVKGGSFTYTPPTTDFFAFKSSLKNLISKPAKQGQRLLENLEKNGELELFDKNHNFIKKINISDFRETIICCFTLDNFTAFSAKPSILKDLNIETPKYPIWSVSLDDLRIYSNIFDSPSKFLHFLEKRKQAASSNIHFNDELDHLGAYIEHNCYVNYYEQFDRESVMLNAYSEKFDTYHHYLLANPQKAIKPKQNTPSRLEEIIKLLDIQQKSKLASLLLDLGGDERSELHSKLEGALVRQAESKYLMPIIHYGGTCLTMFCIQDQINYVNSNEIENYIYANMLISDYSESIALFLKYDKNNLLYGMNSKCYFSEDIPE